jgi:hypothetical protein
MIIRKTESVSFPDHRASVSGRGGSGSLCAEGTLMNWVRGVVHSHHVGLIRSGIRIKVGLRTDLRIRWAKKEVRSFVVGQPVVAMFPAATVRLESGMFRRGKQRWIAGWGALS